MESRHQTDIEAMQRRHDAELTALRNESGDRWLSQERAAEIREVVREVMVDAVSRADLTSGGARTQLESGNFAFRSSDGNFLLNIGGQIQARYAYNYQGPENQAPTQQGETSLYGFGLRRVQLIFRGHVLDPSWTYRIQMNFSQNNPTYQGPNTIQQTVNGAVLDMAFIRKDLGDGFGVTVGQWRSQYNYEELVSSRHQQFVERSMISQYFTTKFIQGIQLEYGDDSWRAWLNTNDGGGNRNLGIAGVNQIVEWAFAGRAQYKFIGEWDDLQHYYAPRGTPLGVMVGAAFNWQRGQSSAQNAFNGDFIGNSPGVNASWTADAAFRFDGFSMSGAILGNKYYSRPGGEAPLNSIGAVVQGGLLRDEGCRTHCALGIFECVGWNLLRLRESVRVQCPTLLDLHSGLELVCGRRVGEGQHGCRVDGGRHQLFQRYLQPVGEQWRFPCGYHLRRDWAVCRAIATGIDVLTEAASAKWHNLVGSLEEVAPLLADDAKRNDVAIIRGINARGLGEHIGSPLMLDGAVTLLGGDSDAEDRMSRSILHLQCHHGAFGEARRAKQ